MRRALNGFLPPPFPSRLLSLWLLVRRDSCLDVAAAAVAASDFGELVDAAGAFSRTFATVRFIPVKGPACFLRGCLVGGGRATVSERTIREGIFRRCIPIKRFCDCCGGS